MKKRDLFWINKIIWLFGILAVFILISLYNFIQINHLYLDGEKNEINFYKTVTLSHQGGAEFLRRRFLGTKAKINGKAGVNAAFASSKFKNDA